MSSNSIESIVVGFSGHRKLSNPSAVQRKIKEKLNLISEARAHGVEVAAISSVAAGSDVLFCETAIDLGIPLLLALPFSEDLLADDFQGEFKDWWPRAQTIIATCKSRGAITLIDSHFSRDDSYYACGKFCVDNATVLLAVANTGTANSAVGAQAMAEYAESIGCPTIRINPQDLECESKNEPIGPSANAIVSEYSGPHSNRHRFFPRIALTTGNAIGSVLRFLIQTLIGRPLEAIFWFFAESSLSKKAPPSSNEDKYSRTSPTSNQVRTIFENLDKQAYDINLFRYCATTILFLEIVGIIIIGYVLAYSPESKQILSSAKAIISVTVILILTRLLIGHGASEMRVHAEAFRAIHSQMKAGSPLLIRPLNQIGKYSLALERALFSLRLKELWENTPNESLHNLKTLGERYTQNRIDDQFTYYKSKAEKAEPWAWLLTLGYRLSLFLVSVISVGYFLKTQFEWHLPWGLAADPKSTKLIFYLIPLGLAGLGTFAMATLPVQEIGRRTDQYREAAEELLRQKARLKKARTASEHIRVMSDTESYLASEVFSWQTYSLLVNKH